MQNTSFPESSVSETQGPNVSNSNILSMNPRSPSRGMECTCNNPACKHIPGQCRRSAVGEMDQQNLCDDCFTLHVMSKPETAPVTNQ